MNTLQIDIVSDIACPWCAIGYARLEQAMATLADDMAFNIEWHPFELNPDGASDGEHILQALSRKYGRTPAEMKAQQGSMMDIAAGLGLNFRKLQERHTRNTFDAHRLVAWAGEQGHQTVLKSAFFDAYFGHAENVSDPDILVRCVDSVGLDGSRAREILASDDYAKTVREDEARYQQAGVSAVPAFIINQQYMISGAQEPDTLVQTFREIDNSIEAQA